MNTQPRFNVDGHEYTLPEMLAANVDDEELCDWLTSAEVGEVFPAFVPCERVA